MRFRPLTGINFNARAKTRRKNVRRFRPLTGINFNAYQVFVDLTYIEFPSPHGDKFQPDHNATIEQARAVFVPSRG